MEPIMIVPHFTTFTLFAIYTYVFSTGSTDIPVIFLIDYTLASVQAASLLLFVLLYPKAKFTYILIKVCFIILTLNFLVMSFLGFITNSQISTDQIKLFVTRLILAVLETALIIKFPLFAKPHPPASPPMSKPPSYSTFAPLLADQRPVEDHSSQV